MSFQAYLDNVKAKTGKTPEDFKILAEKKGLVKHGDVVAWLKSDFGLGHGHANAVTEVILHANDPKLSVEERIAKHFSGSKAGWRKSYDDLIEKVRDFGGDVTVSPTNMVTHRVRIDDPNQIDTELITWLHQAYDKA